MKFVTFAYKNSISYGILEEETLFDLPAAARSLSGEGQQCPYAEGGQFPPDLLSLLDLEENFPKAAAWVLDKVKEKGIVSSGSGQAEKYKVLAVSGVTLKAPLPSPRKVFCVAENYTEHIAEANREDLEHKESSIPRIFIKPVSNTMIGPEEPIIVSKNAVVTDWEAELAVVIGKRCKYVPAQNALEYVAGYTIFNDVSERDLTIKNRTVSSDRDRFFAWLNGKWLDSFAPTGPYFVTQDEVGDPQDLNIKLWVNDQEKQNSNTSCMIDSVVSLIEYLSQIVTLEPGDIIATGTPSGVGFPKGEKLIDGDIVEIEIEKIGRLRNPVKNEG
jgi:acylpyruvate hydrolase